MGVIVSAYPSTPRDLSDAQNAEIDAANIHVSHGNWREHLSEVYMRAVEDEVDIASLSRALADFTDYHAGKIGLSDHTRWHLALAGQLNELAAIGARHGCDRIGIAG